MQAKVNGRWKVIAHPHKVFLTNVKFYVQAAGHARVIRDKVKNVHAFIQGELNFSNYGGTLLAQGEKASYNPYKMAAFHLSSTLAPLKTAQSIEVASGLLGNYIKVAV